jgi:serine O-acetyltransferase
MSISLRDCIGEDLNRFFFGSNQDVSSLGNWQFGYMFLKHLLLHRGFRAIFFYRLHQRKQNSCRAVRAFILMIDRLANQIELSRTAQIGKALFIPHGQCIVIGARCVIGNNVTINQGVTVGEILGKEKNGRRSPIIEDNVMLGAGSKVLGPVTIGRNAMIGGNAVVIHDIPKDAVAVGVPARVVGNVSEPYHVRLKKIKLDS